MLTSTTNSPAVGQSRLTLSHAWVSWRSPFMNPCKNGEHEAASLSLSLVKAASASMRSCCLWQVHRWISHRPNETSSHRDLPWYHEAGMSLYWEALDLSEPMVFRRTHSFINVLSLTSDPNCLWIALHVLLVPDRLSSCQQATGSRSGSSVSTNTQAEFYLTYRFLSYFHWSVSEWKVWRVVFLKTKTQPFFHCDIIFIEDSQ